MHEMIINTSTILELEIIIKLKIEISFSVILLYRVKYGRLGAFIVFQFLPLLIYFCSKQIKSILIQSNFSSIKIF